MTEKKTGKTGKDAKKAKKPKGKPGRPRTNVAHVELEEVIHEHMRLQKRVRRLEDFKLWLDDYKLVGRVIDLEAALRSHVEAVASPKEYQTESTTTYFPSAYVGQMADWSPRQRLILALHREAIPLDAPNITAFLQLSPQQQAFLLAGCIVEGKKNEES